MVGITGYTPAHVLVVPVPLGTAGVVLCRPYWALHVSRE